MLPIGYFLLLLFCISANVVHSMEEEQSKPVDKAVTMLLTLKNPTSLNTTQKLPLPIKTDNPADYRFTLDECPSCKKRFATTRESSLKFDFRKHCKSMCQLTKKEVDQALEKIVEPKKIRKITVPCPIEGCKFFSKISRSKSDLRSGLLQHIDSKIHSDNPEKTKKRKLIKTNKNFKKYFDEYGITYSILNSNFVPNLTPRNTDNPDDYRFTLECPLCKKRFATPRESNLKLDFKRHYKSICQLTKEQVNQALKKIVKAKKIRQFTVPCPIEGCTSIQKIGGSKSDLRSRLLAHLDSQRHSNDPEKAKKRKLIAIKESFKEHFKNHGEITLISNPNPNPNKRRKLQFK